MKLREWTRRQIRKDKVGVIPQECARILERMDCSAETYVDFVRNYQQRFRNETGLAESRRESRASVKAASSRK